MKKKIYFIIESILAVILSIYSIIVANETANATIASIKKEFSEFPVDFKNRVIGIYQKAGAKLIIFFAIIVIISSVVLFLLAINNKLLKHKGLVITLSIFTFFFTDRLLVQLLGVVSFIVIICTKRKNPEDFPEKTKPLKKIELRKSNLKDVLLGVLLLVIYFSQFFWSRFIPDKFIINLIIEIAFNIIMLILCITIFNKQLKENFKNFKSNIKSYIKFIFSRLGIAYLFLFAASIISMLATGRATSVNQENLESLPIYYMIPAAIIYAPIVEEILFRGVLRRLIRFDVLFIIVSALVFGLLHTIHEESVYRIILLSLPYCVLGTYLSYAYVKTNNIFTSIVSHAIINSISAIFMMFL